MKRRLAISIQLALGIVGSAQAANNVSGVNFTAGSFTYSGGVNLTNSQLTFRLPPAGDPYGTVSVSGGDYNSSGSTIILNTVLDAGGSTVGGQGTNRILIDGNASGQTTLVVNNNGGAGASTDLNANTFNDAGEGISLAQVSGDSTTDAFVLKDGYVAVGAYQYRLYAYQPGQSDAGQRLVAADANGHWDYRLQNAKAATGGTSPPVTPPVTPPVAPPTTSPGNPTPRPDVRPGLVPQAPSYLVHNNALFAYGQQLIGALHQRLGEIKGAHTRGENAELYVRAIGRDQHYASNLTAQQYGYDYRQSLHGLQIGGNWLKLDVDADRLRMGLALSRVQGHADPSEIHATDGSVLEISRERTRADSVAVTVTWEHGGGLYVDGVVGAGRYRSDVTTPLHAGKAARLESNDLFASVETGYDWALNDHVTLQPQAQVIWQKLDTERMTDVDGVVVDLGTPEQLTWRVGMRALFTPETGSDGSAFAQYVKLNYFDSLGPEQRAFLSGSRFVTGEYGHTAEFGFGLTGSLKSGLSFYGDMSWQQDIGHASREGWAASMGARWAF